MNFQFVLVGIVKDYYRVMYFDTTVLIVLFDSLHSKLVSRISHVCLPLCCQMCFSCAVGMLISFPFDLKTSFPGL